LQHQIYRWKRCREISCGAPRSKGREFRLRIAWVPIDDPGTMTRGRGPTTNQVPSNQLNHVRRYMITLRPRPSFTDDRFGTARPKIQWLGRPQGMTSGWLTDTYHNRELAVEIRSRAQGESAMAWSITGVALSAPFGQGVQKSCSDCGPRATLTLCDFFVVPVPSDRVCCLSACPSSARFPERTEGCQMSTT
jgi:hypothetical protein